MAWHARLQLDYHRDAEGRSVARHTHSGPLRVLQSLYPEGPGVCHNVLVHPPGGLVGGDVLDVQVQVQPHAHALLTTPAATRFYRSEGDLAVQRTHLHVQPHARLEWLPLEAICYSGCLAQNHLRMELEPGAELLGWDITALGLPHAQAPFAQGRLQQRLELGDVWLEQGTLDAQDPLLLDSPLGLDAQRCLATVFLAFGQPLDAPQREALLEAGRALEATHPLAGRWGITSPHPQVLVARALCPVVEPAMRWARALRLIWRQQLWNMPADEPRVWAM